MATALQNNLKGKQIQAQHRPNTGHHLQGHTASGLTVSYQGDKNDINDQCLKLFSLLALSN